MQCSACSWACGVHVVHVHVAGVGAGACFRASARGSSLRTRHERRPARRQRRSGSACVINASRAWLSRESARAHGASSNRGSSLVRERRELFAMPKCAQQRDRAAFEYADTGCGRKLEPITWRVSELSPPLPLGGDCVGYNCRHCRRRPVWTRERGPVDPEQQQHPEG